METCSQEDLERPVRYAARQPILSSDETVIGYDLMFRTNVVHHFKGEDPSNTGRTAIDLSSLLGFDVLCDHRLGFICCTRDTLLDQSLSFLPADKLVVQVGAQVAPDGEVREACRSLKEAGARIALNDFSPDDPREPLCAYADFLKVDIRKDSWEDMEAIAERYGNGALGLVAGKVESREEFHRALQAGYQFFQGYFFCKPETLRTRDVRSNHFVYLELLRALARPELDWPEVEELIKKDPALYYRLLRYLNSAIFGLRGEIRSVRCAMMILGEREFRRWCRVAGAFEMSRHRPSELILEALIRARFGELLADTADHGNADLFLTELLSLMDAILELPMNQVIEGLELDAESRELLMENSGALVPLHRLTLALERGSWREVVRTCDQLKIDEIQVAECFTQAMTWAQAAVSGG